MMSLFSEEFPATPPIVKGAIIKGRHRYRLWRQWGQEPVLGVIMLNPSTANANTDDPTIRRLYGFARREGYGGFCVCNLFAYRASNPLALKQIVDHPSRNAVGGRNNTELTRLFTSVPTILCAWGAYEWAKIRIVEVAFLFQRLEVTAPMPRLVCLGKTKDGSPRHPLYVAADTPWIGFDLWGQCLAPNINEG